VAVGKEVTSAVFVSGSSPLFWEQKSQAMPARLTRNKELTNGPFLEHLMTLKERYHNVFLINLLEKKKEGENLLIRAYEQLVLENQPLIDRFCRYAYFDISEALKKNNSKLILSTLGKL
jgi:hypothetical protein